jgi:hypothetical protein
MRNKQQFEYTCPETAHQFVLTVQGEVARIEHRGPRGGVRDSVHLPIETLREFLHWAWRESTRQTAKG